MGSPAEETSKVEVEQEDVDIATRSPRINLQPCNDLNEEFLPVKRDDESSELKNELEFNIDKISIEADRSHDEEPVYTVGDKPESPTSERRLSLKRSRSSCFDSTPCVQVTYKCLTRESKEKLKELLQQWAEWHGDFVQVKEDSERGSLENGEEMFFPPLQVRGICKSTVSFWMDKSLKQARTEITADDSTPGSEDREKNVPLYDRVASGVLISQETEMSLEGGLDCMEESSRCFNCGSYSHALRECPRPRDGSAINNARKLHAEKRGSANGPRSISRYYQTSPGGKFDDLKPGVLGNEIRQLLGIGELDPPPWLNRMRELGYPPGYLEDPEEEQSGIRIYGTNEDDEGNCIGEDGEIVGEKKIRSTPPVKKMKVCFPGVNAPIPDDADRHAWGSLSDPEHSRFSPGRSREKHGRNFKNRSPAFEAPPGQLSESGSRPGLAPLPRSPHLSKSASDSGRRSPRFGYDEPHPFPPFNHHSGSRQRPHQSPPTANQRFPQRHDSREEDPRRRAWAHARSALQHLHHNDKYSPARRR